MWRLPCRAVTPPPWLMGGADGTARPSSRGRARVHTHALALTHRAAIPSAGLLLLFPSGFFPFPLPPLFTNLTPVLESVFGRGSPPRRHPEPGPDQDRGGEP